MPQLPRIAVSPAAPAVRVVTPDADVFGAQGFEQLVRFGATMQDVADKMQLTADELELTKLKGEYDARVKDTALQLQSDPDYLSHPQKFAEAVRTIQTETSDQTKRSPVKNALQKQYNLSAPEQIVQVKANALKLFNKEQIAKLADVRDQLIKNSVEGAMPIDEAIRTYTDLVQRATSRGMLDSEEGQKLRRAYREQLSYVTALRDIRLDPSGTQDALTAGGYPDLTPKSREVLIKSAEIAVAKRERDVIREKGERRDAANIAFYRKLKADKLTPSDVLTSPELTRQDMDFFMTAMKKGDGKTDPKVVVDILNLLRAPTKSRDEAVKNATEAKLMAQRAYTQDEGLGKTDALSMIESADRIIKGRDPESDRWFKLADHFLKNKFDWRGDVQAFLNPEGMQQYYQIITQLMREQEDDPDAMAGKAIFDRALELAAAPAINYHTDKISAPERPLQEQLPDPLLHREGAVIRDTVTGKRYRRKGKGWDEVK